MLHRLSRGREAKAVLLLGAMLVLGVAGCASQNLTLVENEAQFHQVVLGADKPVLVDFYKGGGCPTCLLVLPVLDQLAEEYNGRVTFVRFEYMKPYFATTSAEISSQYHVNLFPTVVLIDKGQETNRWSLNYNIDDYRQALDAALKARQKPVPVALAPAVKP
jgi:thioredoxin 1